jgi:lipopolysaccharide exporter
MGALGESALSGGISASEPPSGRHVWRSSMAGYAIQAARLLIGFATKLLLARLLLPEVHGVYAWALRVVTIASALRDLGLPYHLVRAPEKPYGTVSRFTLLSGATLAIGVALAAPLFGGLDAELPAVLRVFAIWILLDGLAVVPRAFFERELSIGRLVGPEIWRAVVLAAVAVGLAAQGWGVWSLVWGDLVGAALLAAYSWWRLRGKIELRPDWSLLPGLLRRSSWLFWIWLVLQLVTYLDVFIVGSFSDSATVGLYDKARMVAFLVATIAWPRALFPSLVAFQGDADRFFAAFRVGTLQLLGLQVLASYFLLGNAEQVVRILFGPGWEGAAPILRLLAFVPFLDQFTLLGGELLKARHADRAWLAIMLVNLASLVGFGIWLTSRSGPAGMALANYLLLGNFLMAAYVYRAFGRRARVLVADLLAILLVPLPFFALAMWVAPAGSWLRFGLAILAAALATALLLLRYGQTFRTFYAGPRSRLSE